MPIWLWCVTSGNEQIAAHRTLTALFGQALHNTTQTDTQNDKITPLSHSAEQGNKLETGIWTYLRIAIIPAAHQSPHIIQIHY